jgi:hypothetical protein
MADSIEALKILKIPNAKNSIPLNANAQAAVFLYDSML